MFSSKYWSKFKKGSKKYFKYVKIHNTCVTKRTNPPYPSIRDVIHDFSLVMSTNHVTFFSLNMYVEDKTSCNGPISVIVNPNISVAELKILVQNQFEFPANVQRWILDKTLADNDSASLASLGIDKSEQKIFLYLVAPGTFIVFVWSQYDGANIEQ